MRKRRIAIILAVLLALSAAVTVLLLPRQLRIHIYSRIFPLSPRYMRELLGRPSDRRVIKIGIPGPIDSIKATNLFLYGVEMAAAECNEAGLLPVPLELVVSDDKNKIADVLTVAGSYVEDTDVVAVIGHWGSDFSMAAAQIYENAGIVMLTPASTNPALTERNFRLIFRNAPTDNKIASFLAEYAHTQGYHNISSLYSKDMTGTQVSYTFEKQAAQLGIRVLDKHHVYYNLEELEENYKTWLENGMDAIFIADIITRNESFRNKLIAMNPRMPILATDAYDYDAPLLSLSKQAKSLHVVTFYNPHIQAGEYKRFKARFKELYGSEPDYWAMQGYDSVRLLVEAIRKSGSLKGADIASVLRNPDSAFTGVSGAEVLFDEKGDVYSANMYIKRFINGELSYWEQ